MTNYSTKYKIRMTIYSSKYRIWMTIYSQYYRIWMTTDYKMAELDLLVQHGGDRLYITFKQIKVEGILGIDFKNA